MKILFLEDRPSRQLLFLPNKEEDVKRIKALKEVFMPESHKCKDIIMQINEGRYEFDDDLELLVIHKSALETKGLEYINNFCKQREVKLVCFSGGISQIIYNNEEYELLNINSSDFYSDQLVSFLQIFLEGSSETLLELSNKEWKLSYMLLARQIVGSLTLEKDEDVKLNLQDKLDKINAILSFNFDVSNNSKEKLNDEIKKKVLSI